MVLQSGVLFLSLILTLLGAEWFLSASEKLGRSWGLSPLLIGLFFLAFGTSLPEFFVSHLACIKGHSSVALGNIIGSNVANLFLILGLAGIFVPIKLHQEKGNGTLDSVILHVILSICLFLCLYPSEFYLGSAAFLIGLFLVYVFMNYRGLRSEQNNKNHEMEEKEKAEEDKKIKIDAIIWGKLIFGPIFLYFGSEYLINSTTEIGVLLGIPSYILSAVLLAFGTSLPELITSLMAIYKGHNTDLIAGNIIGSNIFNGAFILGTLGPYDIDINRSFVMETLALVAAGAYLLYLCRKKIMFGKKSGGVFSFCYLLILGLLIFQ